MDFEKLIIENVEDKNYYWTKYTNKKGKMKINVLLFNKEKNSFTSYDKRKKVSIKDINSINMKRLVRIDKNEIQKNKKFLQIQEKDNTEIYLAKPNPFICVKTGPKSDTYSYSERRGVDSIAFIIQIADDEYILTSERKPPMDAREKENIYGIEYNGNGEAFIPTAFGGSNDKIDVSEYKKLTNDEKIEYFKNIVFSEGVEEAGYKVSKEDIVFKGSAFVSTQSNQMCYLYLVDGRNAEIVDKEPDSDMEAMAESKTYSSDEIKKNLIDWKAKFIVS